MTTLLLAGTGKGLIVFAEQGKNWVIQSVLFEGLPVSMVYCDPRTGTWWAGISHRHWGEKLHFSNDEGTTWMEAAIPSYRNYYLKEGKPANLKRIWVMQHAGIDRPGCLWVGTEPGGLFYTRDNGKSFSLVESLWNHPSRTDEKQWFGAGKDDPFIHSIVVDPRDSQHVYIGISCAGIFETVDGGKSWEARNNGLKAAYLPNPRADVGHDPHCVLMVTRNPQVIWQQNHCGVFRTINGGKSWEDVSGPDGFPGYGFALVIDETDENVAWVIPAQSDECRIPRDLKLTVCRTRDGGKSWEPQRSGLPAPAFDLVLRHAFVGTKVLLAFGTANGNIYYSRNGGDSWDTLGRNFASVNSLNLVVRNS